MRIPRFIRALLAVTAALIVATSAHAQAVPGQGTWETTLLGRDINLNAVAATDTSAVYLYDTTLNVTWLRDANANGVMNWATANAWAANLVTGSGGNAISDWRLPTMANPAAACDGGYYGTSYGGSNCDFNVNPSSSEMASLFFSTLGNKSYYNTSGVVQAGYGLTNAGSFQNLQSADYWVGTEYAPDTNYAWGFYTHNGGQGATGNGYSLYAMAVHPGDVAAVPEPETYAMLVAGLGLIGAVARRRRSFDV